MAVTWRTYQKHKNIWTSTQMTMDKLLNTGEDPEHYFRRYAVGLGTFNFLSKSRRGINLSDLYMQVGADIQFAALRWCEEAQRYMFNNHKWHNRTGDAEMGVDATVAGMDGDNLEIFLYHSVPYGIFLEKSHYIPFPHAGDVSIIPETMQVMTPRLTASLQGVLDQ